MKHEFYDVKVKAKVKADVTECTSYGEGDRVRYALKGKTSDGRPLTTFVKKADWDKVKKSLKK